MAKQVDDLKAQITANFAKRLRELRQEKGLSRKALAERAGFQSSAGIRDIEQGLNGPAWDTVVRIAEALGVSIDAFKEQASGGAPETSKPGRPRLGGKVQDEEDSDEETETKKVEIPLRGRVAAGVGTYDESPGETIDVVEKWAGHVAYRVVGNSMIDEGIFHDDYLIVREQQTAEHKQIVVVTLAERGEVCKKYDAINHRLTCQNGRQIQPLADEDIIRGIVVWLIRRY